MLRNIKKRNNQTGFTIIEVLIVLAIAGLILLVVFLAVPALQRTSRNTQRKSDASHLAGLVSDWVSNNAGTTPTGFGTPSPKIDISSEKFAIMTAPTAISAYTAGSTVPPTTDTPGVYTGATCNGNTPVANASARSIVVLYYLEGSTSSSCVSAG
jgi:prepilin-type N-terminal cleavage/methylation domain-containing protein